MGQDRLARWRGAGLSNDPVPIRQKHGPADITTLIEHTSRFLVALKNAEKRTKPIMARIAQALTPLPRQACDRSFLIRGSGFIRLAALAGKDGYANVVLPGVAAMAERGGRECRQALHMMALPRHRYPNTLSQEEPRPLCASLNATPRKCLGFQTPVEAFKANLMALRTRLE